VPRVIQSSHGNRVGGYDYSPCNYQLVSHSVEISMTLRRDGLCGTASGGKATILEQNGKVNAAVNSVDQPRA
jgi:hypothetical protein